MTRRELLATIILAFLLGWAGAATNAPTWWWGCFLIWCASAPYLLRQ